MVLHNCFMAVVIIIAYTIAVMVPPAIVLYPKVKKRSASMRLAVYFVCGNTFASNLVFVLTYLHIFYTPVVWAVLIVTTVVLSFRTRQIPLRNLPVYIISFLISLFGNDLGGRFATKQFFTGIWSGLCCCGRWIRRYILKKPVEAILFAGTVILTVFIFRQGLVTTFGYHASDVPVHNYWINEIIMHQKLFAGGLYPFGYHTVVAYFFILFHIPMMDILSYFNYVIIIYTIALMIILGKKLTKSRYAGYTGPLIYFGCRYIYVNCINRYQAPLPQEFGLIFMFAGILFALDFFRKNKKNDKYAKQDLCLFTCSVSMCLSSHLYTGVALLIACICIGISHLFKFVRPSYFLPLIRSAVIAVVLAGWAIGIGALMGTPLQGSANWQKEVMSQQSGQGQMVTSSSGEVVYDVNTGYPVGQTKNSKAPEKSLGEKITDAFDACVRNVTDSVFYSTISYNRGLRLSRYILYAICFFTLFSFLLRIREVEYGRNLLFVGLFAIALNVIFNALELGLTQIIDMDRAKCFTVIWVSLAMGVFADSVITFVVGFRKKPQQLISDILSLSLILAGGCAGLKYNAIRQTAVVYTQMERNGAIVSLTNILQKNRNFTYTVVSANDELHMMETQGYHVEIDELLRKIEKPSDDTSFTIPTSKVYFFVEKRPLAYFDLDYRPLNRPVTSEGASGELPEPNGVYIYMGDNRFVEMSRMYYFIRELRTRFPEHVHTYYEDRDFICVCLDQDINSPLNLAFDYGYNK